MKTNYTFIAMLVGVVLLSSCENKDVSPIAFAKTEVTLCAGDSLKLMNSVPDGTTFETGDFYVASLKDNGYVKAYTIGSTIVTAKNGNYTSKATVNVYGKYYLYNDPAVYLSKSVQNVKNTLGTPTLETEETLIYSNYGSIKAVLMLMFDSNNVITSACVVVSDLTQTEPLVKYLTERYMVLSISGKTSYVLANATVGVSLSLSNSKWMVIYMPLKTS